MCHHRSQYFPNVRFALLLGIGANISSFPNRGLKHDIRLGDIAVSISSNGHSGIVEYDYGKYETDNTFVLKGSLNKPLSILIGVDGAFQEDEIMNKSRLRKILGKITKQPRFAKPESGDVFFDETFRHVQGVMTVLSVWQSILKTLSSVFESCGTIWIAVNPLYAAETTSSHRCQSNSRQSGAMPNTSQYVLVR